MTFQTEFPDFPAADMPAIPAEMTDTSWHNDMCPSFASDRLGLQLFVDYADKAQREFPEGARFVLSRQDHGVEVGSASVLETDNWDDMARMIATFQLAHDIAKLWADWSDANEAESEKEMLRLVTLSADSACCNPRYFAALRGVVLDNGENTADLTICESLAELQTLLND